MMTVDQIRQLAVAGHEIGSHSITHPYLTQATDPVLKAELEQSRTLLQTITQRPVLSLAYPFGDYDARVIAATKAAGYTSARSVEEGYVSRMDVEAFDLRVQNMTATTTIGTFKAWVDYAKAHNYWLTIVYHEVVPDGSPVCTDPETVSPCLGPYDTTVSLFRAQLDYLQSSGMGPGVMPVGKAFALAQGELHAPVAGTVVLQRAGTTTAHAVTAGFTDPDGDAVTLHYEWALDGSVLDGVTGATVDFAAIGRDPRGQTLSVRVYATDPDGYASPTVEAAAVVVNTAPSAGTVTLAPAAPLVEDTLTATPAGFADDDGDALTMTYAWSRNGTPVTGSGSTLSTAGFAAGDTIRVEGRADDGHGGQSPAAVAEVRLGARTPQATATPTPAPSATPAPTVTPDRTGPAITIVGPKARRYTLGRRLKLSFTVKDPAGVKSVTATLRRTGGPARKVRANTTIRLTRRGRYVFRVTATDRLGNTAARQVVFRVV
jgi:hypothetical protein